MQQAIDTPIPLALANKQRYLLTAEQTRLSLTPAQIRTVINEYEEIDLLWLKIMNHNYVSPNLLSNRLVKEIKLVSSLSVLMTLNAPVLVQQPTAIPLSLLYYPEFEEPAFGLKNYLTDGNNYKWASMACLFARYN